MATKRINTGRHIARKSTFRNNVGNNRNNRRLMHAWLYREFWLWDMDHSDDTIVDTQGWSNVSMSWLSRSDWTVSWGVTISDDSMVFDWVDWRVDTSYWINTSLFSVSARVKTNATGGTYVLIDDRTSPTLWLVAFYWSATSNNLRVSIWWTTINSNSPINDWNEHSITITYDWTTISLYIDWVLNDSDTSSNPVSSWVMRMWARWAFTTPDFYWDWTINHARFYNKSLTPVEINQEHNSLTYSTITDGSLVAQYTGKDFAWTEASPTTIYDTNMIVRWYESNPTYDTWIRTNNDEWSVNWWVTIVSEDISLDWVVWTYIACWDIAKTDKFSIQTRIKVWSISWNQTILSKVSWGSSTTMELLMRVYWWYIRFEMSDWSSHQVIQSLSVINVDQYYDICITFDWSTNSNWLKMYINWALERETTSIISSRQDLSNVLYIWDYKRFSSQTYNQRLTWEISNFRIFDRDLSAYEVEVEAQNKLKSTITDWSLVLQYSWSNFDWTEALPTVIHNTAWVADVSKTNNKAIVFDWTNDYINLNSSATAYNNTEKATVYMEFNTLETVWTAITNILYSLHDSSWWNILRMWISPVSWWVMFRLGSWDAVFGSWLNDWKNHSLALIMEAWKPVIIYIDGVILDTTWIQSIQASDFTNTARVSLGQEWDSGSTSDFFNGTIWNYQMFNKILSYWALERLRKGIPLG